MNETRGLSRFDELAATYEGWFETPLGAFVSRREEGLILRLLQPKAGERVLEVGSGTGYFLRPVAKSGARCVGIEPAADMLAVAMARPRQNIDYVRGRGESLPFADAAFDALLYMTTLEFVQDVQTSLREAIRVVRPGGRLVFGVLNAEGPWAAARRREGGLWREAHFYGSAELRSLLSRLGPLEIDYAVHVPPRMGGLPPALMGIVDGLLRRVRPATGALIGARVTLRRGQ